MLSSNGFSWSHTDNAANNKQKGLPFGKGAIMTIEFNPINGNVNFFVNANE
jgi:hypothetical protein